MSLNGQTQTYMPPTLDGLNIVEADQIYIDGVELDPANLVPYTGANKTLNMGSQAIKTSYAPVANADVVNLLALQNAILYVEGVNVANFVKYTGSNQNVDLGSNNLTVGNAGLTSFSNIIKTELNNVLAGYTPASITVGNNFGTITNAAGVYQATSNATFASLVLGAPPSGEKYSVSLSLKSVDINNNTNLFLYGSTTANITGSTGMILSFNIPPNTTGFTVFTNTITFPVGSTYLLLVYNSQKSGGIDTLYWNAFTMTGVGSVVKNLIAPSIGLDATNKNYVDTQDALRVPYTGATGNVNLGSNSLIASTAQFTGVTNATPALALGVDGSGNLRSFAVPTAVNLLPLNNTWTGTNTFNNTVTMGDTYTTNVNSAFASNQTPIANATNFATGGTDFTGAMPVSVLTKPSYYNLGGAGTLAMSVGLDLGYTGGSFTAGASTTITGSWTANTVSNRIAIITFDVSAHIGKSLRCVWEGVTPLVFTSSPPPFFTVVNGATTVYSSPQPISGTNTYAWNFTPTVGTTTITYTVQSTGTPSVPAFSWTGFSIKQIGASRLAYKTGAKYTATFTNMIASQNMSFSVYQYTAAGGTPLAISDISNIPVTTSAQTITITFSVNIFPTNLGTVVFFFQPSTANQYVRFDSATITRADMTVSGNIQSSVIASSAIVSANPSGNSGNGTTINMTAFNGSFGSIECYDNVNATSANKLPLALQAYGGTVGVGITNPVATFQVIGTGNICGGTNFANLNNYMQTGSLTIGDPTKNYGGGTSFWTSNTAGLLMECLDNTEIAVHDAGTRVASLMYYTNASNTFTMGRDMGWGVANTAIAGTLDTASNITMASGTFRKNSSANANNWAAIQEGGAANSPYMEFYYGSLRRGYIGNATASALNLVAENNCDLNIYTGGSLRMIIKNSGLTGFGRDPSYTVDINGNQRVLNGLNANDSMTVYGPNASWGAYLIVGAGTDRAGGSTAQVISTNGNLHLDGGNSNAMYYGYYANSRGTPNSHLFWGQDIQFSSNLPFQNNAYSWPVTIDNSGKLFRSQSVLRRVYMQNGIGWGGGINIVNCFYRYSAQVAVKISGKLSYYVTGSTRAYPIVRTYHQATGTFTYWSIEAFTNNAYNHVTFPIEVVMGGGDLSSQTGWFDVYVYNNGNCNTDSNDQLWINVELLPSVDF